MVIWLIGLSGSGKTTVGRIVADKLKQRGRPAMFMDGDRFRSITMDDAGHTLKGRRKNADRICRFCKELDSEGIDVVFGVLSLFHEAQDWCRVNLSQYFEVFLDVTMETVRRRDAKGFYARADRGEIENIVGVDIEFPPPKSPNLTIDNNRDQDDPGLIADRIIAELEKEGLLQK